MSIEMIWNVYDVSSTKEDYLLHQKKLTKNHPGELNLNRLISLNLTNVITVQNTRVNVNAKTCIQKNLISYINKAFIHRDIVLTCKNSFYIIISQIQVTSAR
jgi:hypothetical protein